MTPRARLALRLGSYGACVVVLAACFGVARRAGGGADRPPAPPSASSLVASSASPSASAASSARGVGSKVAAPSAPGGKDTWEVTHRLVEIVHTARFEGNPQAAGAALAQHWRKMTPPWTAFPGESRRLVTSIALRMSANETQWSVNTQSGKPWQPDARVWNMNEGSFDHLLAIPPGEAAMTIEASGAIGPINEVLKSGQYPGVTIAAGPLPSLTGRGGVPVGDASLWISNRSSAAKQAAAWKLIQFLDAPEQIAGFATASGYVPIRTSAAESPEVQTFWAANPAYRVAYDQLLQPGGPSANGSVIGAYQGVRDSVRDALVAMLGEGLSPDEAMARAQKGADRAIEDYNTRLGT